MENLNSGWIKLHRKLLNNPIFYDAHLLQIFIYCLLKSNHETEKILFNGKTIEITPGQFVSGRKQASKDMRLKSIMWDRKLHILENLGILNINTNNKFSIITVNHWGKYQENEQVNEQQMNNKRTTNEQQMNTNKNDKNDKNDKKKVFCDVNQSQNVSVSNKFETSKNLAQRTIGYFNKKFKDRTGFEYPCSFVKDIILVNKIIKQYQPQMKDEKDTEDFLFDLIDTFFIISKNDNWLQDKITIGMFYSILPKIILNYKKILEQEAQEKL